MVQITKTSLEASQEAFTKEIADTLEQLGFAPAGIPPGKHSIDCVQSLYSRIVKTYPTPDKRRYNSFPILHPTGRPLKNILFFNIEFLMHAKNPPVLNGLMDFL
jgi:hypothetical protein